MAWIIGQTPPPAPLAPLLAQIGTYARQRLMPKT
jgi:hypothetical protein